MKKNVILLTIIFLTGFILRVAGAGFGLPHALHFDEKGVVTEALRFGKNLNIGFHVKSPPTMIYNFGLYSSYYIYGRITGRFQSVQEFQREFIVKPERFYLIGRIGTAFLFSLAIFPFFFLARKFLKDDGKALLATSFYAISPLDIRSAHVMKEDGMAILFLVIALYSLHIFYEKDEKKNLLILSFFSAVAVNAKQYNILLFIPLLVAFILKRMHPKKLLAFIALFLIFQILTNPYIIITPAKNWFHIPGLSTLFIYLFKVFPSLSEKMASSWAVRATGVGMVGKSQGIIAFLKSLHSFCGRYFILLLLLSLIASILSIKKEKGLLLPLSFVLVHLILLCTYTQTGARYFLPSIPYLSILFAYFSSRLRKGAGFLLLIPLLPFSISTTLKFSKGKTTNEFMVRYIKEKIPYTSRLLVEEISFPSLPMDRSSIEEEFITYKKIFPEIEGTTYKIRMENAKEGYSVKLIPWTYAYSFLATTEEERRNLIPSIKEIEENFDYILITGQLVEKFLRNTDERARVMADFLKRIAEEFALTHRVCADGKKVFGWCTYLFSVRHKRISPLTDISEVYSREKDDIAHY